MSDINKSNAAGNAPRLVKTLLAVIGVIVLILTLIFYPRNVPFWQFEVSDIVVLLVSLLLIATFIERAAEVVIVVWRDKGKKQLENVINLEMKKSEKPASSEPREITRAEEEATRLLQGYKAETGSIAMPLTFTLGIVISALGVKSLQPLVDPAVFKTLTTLQRSLFSCIDTLVTGALLGGGAKGIHEIIEAFLNTVEKYRDHLRQK